MAGEAIFIGYRRDDTADVAGRMHDALARRFGKQRIFMDVDNLRPGADFGEYIKTVLPRCRVALILIGPNWLSVRDERGARRLDDPNDWVRVEVETALATPGLDVVPVLVNGAIMPRAEDLPEGLQPLLRRHAAIIRRNPDFHDDVARLIAALRASVSSGILDLSKIGGKASDAAAAPRERGSSRAPLIGGVVAVAVLVAVGFGVTRLWPLTPDQRSEAPAEASETTADSEAPRAGQMFRDCAVCPEMVVIPAGSFTMGSPASEANRHPAEGPQRRVEIMRFAVGKYEVTRGQWAAFAAATGHADPPVTGDTDCTWLAPGFAQNDNHPVTCVNWYDARDYAAWLSRETGQGYRLLTEAEWEYAARADTTTAYSWGNEASVCDQSARNGANSYYCDYRRTLPVGSFQANGYGLHDMHGNVSEWVEDCYGSGSCWRVIRGGSWVVEPPALRSASFLRTEPTRRENNRGFRVARNL